MKNAWEVEVKLSSIRVSAVRIPAIFAMILALTVASGFAQTAAAPSSQETLLIGPGDQLHISVFDTPELEQHARVTDDGNVPLVFLGNVHVGGLTPEGAARVIDAGLQQKGYMKHPQVTVQIDVYATQGVLVLGQVKSPGLVQIETSRTVLDVLGLAGGLNDLAARKITIERHGTGERVQYFVSNNPEEAFDHSILVHPGDKLMVPKAEIAYLLGDVGKPGGYTFTNNRGQLTALQMLSMAGGTPSTASPGNARLIRRTADGYTETHIQLSDMQKGKAADFVLQPDDIIYVPFNYLKNILTNSSQIIGAAASASIYAVQ
jgi:polysaccharide export outer membrane protein